MFDKLMNNYYYGKAGKGDLTTDDLPTSRWQLFMETLRVRFSGLVRLNLLYMLIWLPTMIVLFFSAVTAVQTVQYLDLDGSGVVEFVSRAEDGSDVLTQMTAMSMEQVRDTLLGLISTMLLILIPCVAITGPFTAGVSYVTRNWSRDEHAFIWTDFKDALKENWKQSLVISFITSLVPFLVYVCWRFYGSMADTNAFMMVPQVLILMLGMIWMLSVTYMHPLIVTYQLRLRDVIRNALLLGVARLPMSIGVRLLHCLPMILGVVIGVAFNVPQWAMLVLFLYYLLLGFTLSRFITASYTNGVFDKYINSRIEGAQVNRGLRADYGMDEDEDEDDEEASEADQ